MTKRTLKTFSFLSGLLLILLIAPQEARASSSTLAATDSSRVTATDYQDINTGGQIVRNNFDSSNTTDRFHSIFASPVPELIAMLLIGFVLNVLWGNTRRLRRN